MDGIDYFGGAIYAVTNTDGSLTFVDTSGNVVGSLNVAHANTWTSPQTFEEIIISGTKSNLTVMQDPVTGNPQFFSTPSGGANGLIEFNVTGTAATASAVFTTDTSLGESQMFLKNSHTGYEVFFGLNGANLTFTNYQITEAVAGASILTNNQTIDDIIGNMSVAASLNINGNSAATSGTGLTVNDNFFGVPFYVDCNTDAVNTLYNTLDDGVAGTATLQTVATSNIVDTNLHMWLATDNGGNVRIGTGSAYGGNNVIIDGNLRITSTGTSPTNPLTPNHWYEIYDYNTFSSGWIPIYT